VAAEVNILIKATDQASSVLGRVAGGMSNIIKVAAGVAAASAAAFAILGKQALDATAEWERMTLSMESLVARELKAANSTLTMTDALALAGDKTQELLGWLQQIAIHSPFDVVSVQTAFRQAMTYGFAADEAKRLTQNIVDFAAANGLTADAMNTVSYALGQINNNDKVLLLDLRQLMQAGVPVVDILREMGYGFEDVTAGAVASSEFLEKFSEVMERDFAGAADRTTKSWAGLLNTLGDLKKMALRELFAGMLDVLQPLVAKFAEWMQGAGMEKMKEWGKYIGNITKNLVGLASSLRNINLSDVLQKLGDFWVNGSARLLEGVREIDWDALSKRLADGIDNIDWNLLGQKFAAGFKNIFRAIGDIVREVNWAELFASINVAMLEFFVGLFGQSMARAKSIISTSMQNIKTALADGMKQAMQGAAAAILGGIGMVLTAIYALRNSLAARFTELRVMAFSVGQGMMIQIKQGVLGAVQTAIAAVAEAIARIKSAIGKGISIPISFSFSGGGGGGAVTATANAIKTGNYEKRAAGGPVNPYGIYRVGENGPETLIMGGMGGRVLPSGSSAGSINVTVNLSSFISLADQRDAADKLTPIIQQAIRNAQGVI